MSTAHLIRQATVQRRWLVPGPTLMQRAAAQHAMQAGFLFPVLLP